MVMLTDFEFGSLLLAVYFVLVIFLTLKLVPCLVILLFFCDQGEDWLRAWPSSMEDNLTMDFDFEFGSLL